MVGARPLAAPSGFARTLLRLCFAKLLASLVGGPDGFAAGASRAQATRRLPARANDARPRNAAGLSCGVPPPERARQRVGQKVAWMLHPVTSVTTRERPSPRAAASFRPSAHDKPQRHENCLRSTRKRPLRGLHEKHEVPKGRLRRGTRKTATSKESVSPLFDNGLRIGAKIDEQTKLAAGQPKVIHQLRPVFLGQ